MAFRDICIVCIIMLLIFSNRSNAQDLHIDSLISMVEDAQTPYDKITYLNDLSYAYWNTNPEKGLECAIEALDLAKKTNNNKGIAAALNNLGLINYSWGNFKLALDYHKKALDLRKITSDDIGLGYTLNNIGFVYNRMGDYERAYQYFRESLSVKAKTGDKKGYANTLNHIGKVFHSLGVYKKALDYFNKSIELKKDIGYDRGIAYTYNAKANTFIKLERIKDALTLANKALSVFDSLEVKQGKFLALQTLGRIGLHNENLENAERYFRKALNIQDDLNNKSDIVRIMTDYGKVLFKMGKINKAIQMLKEANKTAEKINANKDILDIYDNLSEFYRKSGQYKEALNYFQLYSQYKDKILSERTEEKISEVNARYEFAKRRNQILKQKQQISKLEVKREALIKNFIVSVTFLITVIALIVIYYLRRSKRNEKRLKVEINERIKIENDLSEAKNKAEESDRLKSAFLANMSHEIRTPMNAIIGFSDLIADESLTIAERQEYVDYIQSAGKNLLMLIDDIIDIAKIEAGQLRIVIKKCDITDLFDNLLATFNKEKERYNKEELSISYHIANDLKSVLFYTDPNRLRQVFTNLIGNALKFTETGDIRYSASASAGKIIFTVSDTGQGIPEEKQELIFNRFVKLDENKSNLFRGTGLGLTITKNLLQLLDGNIKVKSEEGKGTTFIFHIPFQPVKESDANTGGTIGNISDLYNWKGKDVVIAENEYVNYTFLEKLLKDTGINIRWAKNGQEAIDMVDAKVPDIVLMDIKMPVLNGYKATVSLRRTYPNLPIIAQTAFAMADERDKIIVSGCNDYLAKPIKKEELLEKMSVFLA